MKDPKILRVLLVAACFAGFRKFRSKRWVGQDVGVFGIA